MKLALKLDITRDSFTFPCGVTCVHDCLTFHACYYFLADTYLVIAVTLTSVTCRVLAIRSRGAYKETLRKMAFSWNRGIYCVLRNPIMTTLLTLLHGSRGGIHKN